MTAAFAGVSDPAGSAFRVGALAACLLLGACGGGASDPPVVVSLVAPSPAEIPEAGNRTVTVSVSVNSTGHRGLAVPLLFSGTATRDYDYVASSDSIVVPPGAAGSDMQVEVFRDFESEGDETITISLGAIRGIAQPGSASSITITVVDGEAAQIDKSPDESGFEPGILPFSFAVTETSFDFVVLVLDAGESSSRLIAEWSSDRDFAGGGNLVGALDIPPFDPEMLVFLQPYEFRLPLDRLAPNGHYYIRVYPDTVVPEGGEAGFFSFATDAQGKVVTQCGGAAQTVDGVGPDPLFAEQWHLQNTGQRAFSRNPGVPGADLRMTEAIANGWNGAGVKLAVVDSGLEICHPDLMANVEDGKSYNFGWEQSAGASLADPFNVNIHGDHGTGVAGVAAAAANNGLGGRGVAPEVRIRGFNPATAPAFDLGPALLRSLGASDSQPDSASADIFNMSFGSDSPTNSDEDFERLMKMGTSELRSGRGALYVKAAGNEFSFCGAPHPLNAEIGCFASNADPDQNLPYLVNVGAFNAADMKSSYSSAGANLWVVAPGGEDGAEHPAMITADQQGSEAGFNSADDPLGDNPALNPNGDYMANFGGTSSAAPATAGAIAAMLGVNPGLTWRDVKHILATTARRIDPGRAEVRAAFKGQPYVAQHAWQENAAGYHYHNWYGFGAIALDDAVALAADYTPDGLGAFEESRWFPPDSGDQPLPIPDEEGGGVTDTLIVSELPDWANIEAVTLEISVDHSYGADLGVTITSPGGTESIVNPPFNVLLNGFPGLFQWRLLSNAFYGENPNGEWKINVVDLAPDDTGSLTSWRLRFHYGDHP